MSKPYAKATSSSRTAGKVNFFLKELVEFFFHAVILPFGMP